MNNKHLKKAFGALPSPKDSRTVIHKLDMAVIPPIKGGYDYLPTEILDQHSIGICVAISIVQNVQKINGKKYSPDFQYLLQKKFYDLNWDEGSAIINALKVGVKYGFLPANLWTITTEADRELPYAQYIAKLQQVTDVTIQNLLALCVDKIPGYASVDVSSSTSIASAIIESQAGILCRYSVGDEWYTDIHGNITWDASKLCPITPRNPATGGHAINMEKYNYTVFLEQFQANTWGTEWCPTSGICYTNWNTYKPTEAWLILNTPPIIPPFQFLHDLSLGITSPDVLQLQIFLNKNPLTQIATIGAGSPGNETKFFGSLTKLAVIKFQHLHNITPSVGYVGLITRSVLNLLINK